MEVDAATTRQVGGMMKERDTGIMAGRDEMKQEDKVRCGIVMSRKMVGAEEKK